MEVSYSDIEIEILRKMFGIIIISLNGVNDLVGCFGNVWIEIKVIGVDYIIYLIVKVEICINVWINNIVLVEVQSQKEIETVYNHKRV